MGLKDLHHKLKGLGLRKLLVGDIGRDKKEGAITKNASWMIPISHGYHVVERHKSFSGGLDDSDCDSVVVQREQIEEIELWFFGLFDALVGDRVTKYLQSHLFGRKMKESRIGRKSKETMRKAYLRAKAKIRDTQEAEETKTVLGSVSAMVINGEKLVIANMGDYRAVVCKDGIAHQLGSKNLQSAKRHWSRRLISVRILPRKSNNGGSPSKGSELLVGAERIDSDTEFVILASNGIWEVMKNQEAVNLIRHIEDPQEAAECLAKESLTRMSKSNISCLVIRFD
ncbi:putative protein phosphatase 2C-like protein 44 isoform X2 [Ziziphus jujuba]|uniref:PPM-type phosphatase domain-containing protein n=1 Tax=Ziziphus jujuba TaxID=326968 RepID=A0A6P4AH79_ZIZJJ|nr:putative protein phosphatase 2C-like protein 44 isoform X2 [Ziziphus jujuba]